MQSNKTMTNIQVQVKKHSTMIGIEKGKKINMNQLLKLMIKSSASDLHVRAGVEPALRIYGDVLKINSKVLTREDSRNIIYQVLTDEQKKELEKNLELDFSFAVKNLARFRANVFYSTGGVSGVFRQIPSVIPDFKQLNLPNVMLDIIDAKSGIVLITGPTGSGKTTTVASLLDHINKTRNEHIMTLEDPIEFVHKHHASVITQREIGSHSFSFKNAVRSLLRQDPDVVLLGELRDLDTVEYALKIAETGHLVFATLHTNSAIQTINRVINMFPADRHDQVRTLLSFVLRGVVAQQLIPKSFESGRICAMEIMRLTPGISNLIKEAKVSQIYSQMQIGQDKSGMVTMNQSLAGFVTKKIISEESAHSFSSNREELVKLIARKS